MFRATHGHRVLGDDCKPISDANAAVLGLDLDRSHKRIELPAVNWSKIKMALKTAAVRLRLGGQLNSRPPRGHFKVDQGRGWGGYGCGLATAA